MTAPADPAADASPVRLRLDVAYDGTDFSGWATQPGLRTVQQTVEEALALIMRSDPVSLTVAGRTDAGVHARGQVCHVDVSAQLLAHFEPTRLARRLTRLLPPDVVVRRSCVAPAGFEARFSAIWRRYRYRLCDDEAKLDPLRRRDVLTWRRPLDVDAMNDAARRLLGEHDFAAFCKRREGATTVRELKTLTCTRSDALITAEVRADAFCHHMVRSLVGALVVVGEGRRPVDWPSRLLATGVRDPRSPVVAARGLTLEEVGYPPDADLAERARTTRTMRTVEA